MIAVNLLPLRQTAHGVRSAIIAAWCEPVQRFGMATAVVLLWGITLARALALPVSGSATAMEPASYAGLGLTSVVLAFVATYGACEGFSTGSVNLAVMAAGGRARHYLEKSLAAAMGAAAISAVCVTGQCLLTAMVVGELHWAWGKLLLLVAAMATNAVVAALGTGVGFLVRGGGFAVMTVLALLCLPGALAREISPRGSVAVDLLGGNVLSLLPLFAAGPGPVDVPWGSYLLLVIAAVALAGGWWRLASSSLPR